MRALVTSVRAPHALAILRGLARRGWTVTAADTTRFSPGIYSRLASRRLVLPNLSDAPAKWSAALIAELQARPYDLLVPGFEDAFMVARLGDRVTANTRVLGENFRKLMRVRHKPALGELARQIGASIPETWQPEDVEQLRGVAGDLPYPVVLKLPAANNSLGLATATDPASLVKAWRALHKRHGLLHGGMPLIQRRVDGDQISTLAIAQDGMTLGLVTYESLLMFPEGGGTAFCRRSLHHPEVEALTAKLLSHLEWTGFMGLDFIVDARTGRPLLIDANPRPTPALQVGLRAGVDFIEIIDAMARGKTALRRPIAVPGAKTRTLFVYLLWIAFMLVPGRGWRQRLKRVKDARRHADADPDFHDAEDKRPSWLMAFYVPFFMLVIEPLRGVRGGYMYGATYDSRTDEAARTALSSVKPS
ncbi:MAG: ATP-grasp domain-containing protein [Myxococcota bacterium]